MARLAALHHDGTLAQWDVASERQLWAVPAHTELPDGLAYSADGSMLASVSWDGTVRLSSVDTGDEIRRFGPVGYRLRGVAFHPNGQQRPKSDNRLCRGPTANRTDLPTHF